MKITFVLSPIGNSQYPIKYEETHDVSPDDDLINYFYIVTTHGIKKNKDNNWLFSEYFNKDYAYFLYDINYEQFNYNLNDDGSIQRSIAYGYDKPIRLSTLEQFNNDELFDWDRKTIIFAPVSGIGAGAGDPNWLYELCRFNWTYFFQYLGYFLDFYTISTIIRGHFGLNKKSKLRKIAESFVENGFYEHSLYTFILKKDTWNTEKLKKYLSLDEINLNTVMRSLGYKPKQRGKIYTKDTSSFGQEQRAKWHR